MRKRPHHEHPGTSTPFWKVMAVFDPDGTGQDFGYTIGLSTVGHPELHMWARPTDGHDPGADFRLSASDITVGLNRFADLLLSGELRVGDRHEVSYDDGLTGATFIVGEPVIPDEVDAHLVDPDALVIPMRWELHREPEGESRPVTDEVAELIERSHRFWQGIHDALGGGARTPKSPVGSGTDTGHRQRWGPWTGVIEMMRASVGCVGDAGLLSWCIEYLEGGLPEIGYAMAVASAHARRHGRSSAFSAAEAAGWEDGHRCIDGLDERLLEVPPERADDLLGLVRPLMGRVLGACYALMTVRDLVDEPARSLVYEPVHAVCQYAITRRQLRTN